MWYDPIDLSAQHTPYLGHLSITPTLNDAEVDQLIALHAIRDDHELTDRDDPRIPPGLPRVDLEDWCGWCPTEDGRRLQLLAGVGTGMPAMWLRWLIAHLLKPGALGLRRPDRHRGFTFDHRLDGMVVGLGESDAELVAITVRSNRVRQRRLWPTDAMSRSAGHPVLDLARVVPLDSRRRASPQVTSRRPVS